MLCDDPEGWGCGAGREVSEGGAMCIHTADSLHCTAETNSIVKQLYSNKKKIKSGKLLEQISQEDTQMINKHMKKYTTIMNYQRNEN